MDLRLIALDLDGTTLNSQGKVSPYTKKILENNYKKNNNKFKIIINNYNKYSIDEKIIKNIFKKNKIIGKIPYIEKYEKLINENFSNKKIFSKINYLIDGPFIQSERDLTLELRGSKNQCIIGFL